MEDDALYVAWHDAAADGPAAPAVVAESPAARGLLARLAGGRSTAEDALIVSVLCRRLARCRVDLAAAHAQVERLCAQVGWERGYQDDDPLLDGLLALGRTLTEALATAQDAGAIAACVEVAGWDRPRDAATIDATPAPAPAAGGKSWPAWQAYALRQPDWQAPSGGWRE